MSHIQSPVITSATDLDVAHLESCPRCRNKISTDVDLGSVWGHVLSESTTEPRSLTRTTNRSTRSWVAAVAAGVLVLAAFIPQLLRSNDSSLDQAGTPLPAPSALDGDASQPEEPKLLVSQLVPGLGQFSLSTGPGATSATQGMTCYHIGVPRTLAPTTPESARLQDITMCADEYSTADLVILPVESCNDDASSLDVAVVGFAGLAGDTVTLSFGDGTRQMITATSGAAIWAWENTTALTDIEVSDVEVTSHNAIELPIGPCP